MVMVSGEVVVTCARLTWTCCKTAFILYYIKQQYILFTHFKDITLVCVQSSCQRLQYSATTATLLWVVRGIGSVAGTVYPVGERSPIVVTRHLRYRYHTNFVAL